MENKNRFTRLIASVGTMLVLFPVVMPVLLLLASLVTGQGFNFDYLMPAELFPSALAGGALLLWASLRARLRRKLIAWSLGAAIGLPFVGQALAVVTGLASGDTPPESGWVVVIWAALAAYTAALVALGVGGVLLVRDVFRSAGSSATAA